MAKGTQFIYFCLLVIWMAFECFYSVLKTGKRLQAKYFENFSHKVLYHLFIWIGLVLAIMTSLLKSCSIANTGNGFFIGGLSLIVAGLFIRWYAIQLLGKYFTSDVALFENHQIIEAGIYKLIRHPGYAGRLLTFIGLGFTLKNWLSLLILFVFPLTGIAIKIHTEEKFLLNYMGEHYKNYMKRTKRVIVYLF